MRSTLPIYRLGPTDTLAAIRIHSLDVRRFPLWPYLPHGFNSFAEPEGKCRFNTGTLVAGGTMLQSSKLHTHQNAAANPHHRTAIFLAPPPNGSVFTDHLVEKFVIACKLRQIVALLRGEFR